MPKRQLSIRFNALLRSYWAIKRKRIKNAKRNFRRPSAQGVLDIRRPSLRNIFWHNLQTPKTESEGSAKKYCEKLPEVVRLETFLSHRVWGVLFSVPATIDESLSRIHNESNPPSPIHMTKSIATHQKVPLIAPPPSRGAGGLIVKGWLFIFM